MDGNRILLADSDQTLLKVYASAFERGGEYEVRTASSVKECLRLLREFSPDGMVIQRELLGGGGEGIIRSMAADSELSQVPVVLTSSAPSWVHPAPFKRAPVVECLQQPIAPRVLLDAMLRALAGRTHAHPPYAAAT